MILNFMKYIFITHIYKCLKCIYYCSCIAIKQLRKVITYCGLISSYFLNSHLNIHRPWIYISTTYRYFYIHIYMFMYVYVQCIRTSYSLCAYSSHCTNSRVHALLVETISQPCVQVITVYHHGNLGSW